MQRYSYKVYVTVGRIGAIRQLFEKISKSQPYKRPAGDPAAEGSDSEQLDGASNEVKQQQQKQQQQQQQQRTGLETEQLLLGRNPGLAGTGDVSSSSSSSAAAVRGAAEAS
jgi:hypothetical protein